VAVSGTAVAVATAGGWLLYSGWTNTQPIDVLKDLLGRPNAGRQIVPAIGSTPSGLGTYNPGKPATVTSAGTPANGGALVAAARAKIGAPYRWAATGPDRFDCSGLVYWALRQSGWNPPRFTTATFGSWASAQGWKRYTGIELNAEAGDVILKAGHMAICSGLGTMIDAPHTGAYVREEKIWRPYAQWWGWRPAPAAEDGREQRRAA
jgi:cell wall-associated NlpC family hydrolase